VAEGLLREQPAIIRSSWVTATSAALRSITSKPRSVSSDAVGSSAKTSDGRRASRRLARPARLCDLEEPGPTRVP
jgi:hypothetical protein